LSHHLLVSLDLWIFKWLLKEEISGITITYWCFLVDWFDHKFFVVERDVSDFTPWEAYFGGESEREGNYNLVLKILHEIIVYHITETKSAKKD
jgi:hypothetical protein